jgi:hypothetical protein
VPILTMNLLQALPKTPLWDRLARDGRLVEDPSLESNVRFLRPHDEVVASWRRAIAHAYAPERIFARFRHQIDATYANRIETPHETRLTWINIKRGLYMAANLVWRLGIASDYRRPFWAATRHALSRGQIDAVFGMGFVAHHLIRFTREALRGEHNASFYAARARERGRERLWSRMRRRGSERQAA